MAYPLLIGCALAIPCYAWAAWFAPDGARLSQIPPLHVAVAGIALVGLALITALVFFGFQATVATLLEWPPTSGIVRVGGASFLASLGIALLLHAAWSAVARAWRAPN